MQQEFWLRYDYGSYIDFHRRSDPWGNDFYFRSTNGCEFSRGTVEGSNRRDRDCLRSKSVQRKVQLCLDNGRCVAHRRTGGHGAGRQRERLENGLLFDVFRVAHGHCPRFGGEKGGGAEEILSVLMHVGLIVFNLNNIVSTEFFDDDVGSFLFDYAWRRR